APLKEEAWSSAARRPDAVEAGQLTLVDPAVAELLQKALVDLFRRPAKREGQETAALLRLRARERHVADETMGRVRRALDAEAVTFGVAHDRPDFGEVADRVRLRLDELAAELEAPLQLRFAVRDIDVEVDRHFNRRRFRHPVEGQRRPFSAGITGLPAVAGGLRFAGVHCRP